jgi:hypothetical protein
MIENINNPVDEIDIEKLKSRKLENKYINLKF